MALRLAGLSLAAALLALGCRGEGPTLLPTPLAPMSLVVQSAAFSPGDPIPARYTCDGGDVSPPLSWFGAPKGTVSYVLVMDDPDAPGGGFVHWLLYDLPADLQSLPEGIPVGGQWVRGALQGRNDAGRVGYSGPCPPRGPAHRYRFSLYALDTFLRLGPGASLERLARAMSGHVLAWGQLVGTYARYSSSPFSGPDAQPSAQSGWRCLLRTGPAVTGSCTHLPSGLVMLTR
ncbi:MAG TPA: YbhB/YbcL family Raf kinase inhibitor-like protein [Dehalococcoidia bacterium]|nr:YbhB/YbcL family Raf kinase inhibitor-like protein [Dehalococcoidia bacterium]